MTHSINVEIPPNLRDTYDSIIALTFPPTDLDSLVGANVAALSMIRPNGSADVETFKNHYDWFIQESWIRGLMIGGANGEGDSLTNDNYSAFLGASQDFRLKYGTKIIAGVFKSTSFQILEQLEFLKTQQGNFDYLMVALPLDQSLSSDELVELFREIKKIGIEKKIVLYRTKLSKTDADIETLIRMHDANGNLMAVKDTMPAEKSLYLEFAENKIAQRVLQLYEGNDHMLKDVFYKLLEIGNEFVGNISGGGNVLPLTQLRQILVAAIVNSRDKTLGADLQSEYVLLADQVQKTIGKFYDNTLKPYRKDISPDDNLGGRRDAMIIKRMIDYYFPGIPLRPVNQELMKPMTDVEELRFQISEVINARNNYLAKYVELQTFHPNL